MDYFVHRFFQTEYHMRNSAIAEVFCVFFHFVQYPLWSDRCGIPKVKLALSNGKNDAAANGALQEAELCGLGENLCVNELRKMLTDVKPMKDRAWTNKCSFHYD